MLFSGTPKSRPILILEIQSSLVRGSIVVHGDSESPQVIFTQSMEVLYKPHAGTAQHMKSVTKAVQEMCHMAVARLWTIADSRPDLHISERLGEVHFVLSSPWIVSQARTISLTHEKETSISKDSLKTILADERKKIGMEEKMDAVTIEEKIFHIKLNGYPVADWEGKSTKTIEVSYALSVGSKDFIEKLQDIAVHAAQCKNVSFHSSLLLNYVFLGHGESHRNTFALIHVHGELTDIAVVRNGSCSFFGSFPIGNNTIVRRISEALGLDRKSADSLLSLYIGEHLDMTKDPRSTTEITKQGSLWANELGRLCDSDNACRLPANIYLMTPSHEPLFVNNLQLVSPQSKTEAFPTELTTAYAIAIHSLS